jgi:hypothetical protein
MIGKRSPLLAVALLSGALFAGCGSSGGSSTPSSSTPAATTASTPSTQAATTASTASTQASTGTASTPSTTLSTTAGAASAAGVAEYVAICKEIVQREPTLSSAVKSKVEGICAKAASGDEAGARAAAKEVCTEVINASPIPTAAKEKALAECKAT